MVCMGIEQRCSRLYKDFSASYLQNRNVVSVHTQRREAASRGEEVGPQIRRMFAICSIDRWSITALIADRNFQRVASIGHEKGPQIGQNDAARGIDR